MKNGKVARKKKKDRVNAYIEPGLKKQAMQFMDSDEHYETYKNGRFGLLITNALKAYMRIE